MRVGRSVPQEGFTAVGLPKGNLGKPLRKRFLAPLGVVANFVDTAAGEGPDEKSAAPAA